jgi:hypothetical protein
MTDLADDLRQTGFNDAKNPTDVYRRFHELARSIMCSHKLVCGDYEWRITSLELYLNGLDFWSDPYTHDKPAQLDAGTWYVHDDGRRAPTYSGVDITCGSKELGVHGGLLIREIDGEQRWVFQRIVRGNGHPFERKGNKWKPEEATRIVGSIHNQPIDAETSLLRLVSCEPINSPLYSGPRIGLQTKAENPIAQRFRTEPLRIATWLTKHNQTAMRRLDER